MSYSLDIGGETRSLISHLPPSRKQKVRESLQAIAEDPSQGKPLQEELEELYSYRVGTLRIIYRIDSPLKKVRIITIGPRRTIYEELSKAIAPRK